MKNKIAFVTLLFLTITNISHSLSTSTATIHISCIAISGDTIAWCNSQKLYLSTVSTFPSYTTYQMDDDKYHGCGELKWSGNGEDLYAIKPGRLIKFNYSRGKLTKSFVFNDSKLSPFYLFPNKDGSRLIVAIDGENTKYRSPGWRVGAELVLDESTYKTTSVFGDTIEGFVVDNIFTDGSGKVYFAKREDSNFGFYSKYKINNGGVTKDFYDCGRLRLEDVSSTGRRLLFSGPVKGLKDKTGDELFSLYVADVKDEKVGTPMPVLIPHLDPISWNAQFGWDDDTVIWTHFVRGEDGNQIIKRSMSYAQYNNGKWTRPATLFEIPPTTGILDVAVGRDLIATVVHENKIIVFDKRSKKATMAIIDVEL